ncbi:hypothetical protein [Roseovarius sp. BRH_c41]|uniref:hypothetical protein n=1 Tax=Roseovarius sp. BRH_c41 TaxID=1629709 RepID=UPI0005F22599|nr:hypothetical protein [Roseovarius sp. BRH_c41]KJS44827.1 MAG: hypothetical protein VR71_04200 [Roseovarius sp. BRH_c41]
MTVSLRLTVVSPVYPSQDHRTNRIVMKHSAKEGVFFAYYIDIYGSFRQVTAPIMAAARAAI